MDQTSIAFVYATGGKELFIEDVVVDIARSVVTVRATLAGALNLNKSIIIYDPTFIMIYRLRENCNPIYAWI